MQLVVDHRQRQQRGVEFAFAQALQQHIALFFHQQQFQLGEARADARNHVRQQIRAQGGEDPQAHRTRFRIAAASRRFLQLLHFGHDHPCPRGRFVAGRGQHHLARRAFHQRQAQFLFQLADLRRQRRLADEAGSGGPAEVLVIGQGHQVFQVTQVHPQTSRGTAPAGRCPAG
ncbi:hypothetical protein D3C73_1296420 [compost metagenome]